jgi:trans-2,3-dihydro-3-hydroxyanthranilate isomerase
MRRYPFVLLDVFTSRPLEGNQLAVFTDGRGLSDLKMQQIAKETNLSETTFIIPRDEPTERERGVQVRIFTTQEELPFAGHPTLGTATVIRGDTGTPKIELDLRVGKIPVFFEDRDGGPAYGEMRQMNPQFGKTHSVQELAKVTGLKAVDFREDVPVQTVNTGVAFLIVPIKSLAMLQRMRLDWFSAEEYLRESEAKFFYFITTETVFPDARVHARMIFYSGEDPATGSAAGCCAGWLVKHGIAKSNERVLIEQGLEINRPSRIYVTAEKHGDTVTNVRVGGHTVEIARGEYRLH